MSGEEKTMSIDRIKLRKKYYDGNMVREAVMSVIDDYNTLMKLLKAFANQPPLPDVTEVVRCKDCKHRDPEDRKCDCGHDILWQLPRDDNWFCADGERRRG